MAALFEHDLWGPLLGSLIGAAVALAGGAAIAWILVAAFGRWARQTSTAVDDLVVKRLASPVRWVFPLTALLLALPELDFAPRARRVRQAGARHRNHPGHVLGVLARRRRFRRVGRRARDRCRQPPRAEPLHASTRPEQHRAVLDRRRNGRARLALVCERAPDRDEHARLGGRRRHHHRLCRSKDAWRDRLGPRHRGRATDSPRRRRRRRG